MKQGSIRSTGSSRSQSKAGRKTPPAEELARFRVAVMTHYATNGRDLPWRRTRDPYLILVSEIMLQQTQVPRVILKYESFAALFPTPRSLADAPTADVLRAWQGLGYNRRGLNLQRAAAAIVSEHAGRVPNSRTDLLGLPGVGPATAAAVCAFAFGVPVAFLETNIRSAYIHHFFEECSRVSDAELLPLVEATLDRDNPRDWYYALMDYGAWLKKTNPNPSRRSRHHTTQPPFAGSHRQLRAQILRVLLAHGQDPADVNEAYSTAYGISVDAVHEAIPDRERDEIATVLAELTREGFLMHRGGGYAPA